MIRLPLASVLLVAVAALFNAQATLMAQDLSGAAGRCEVLDFPNRPETRSQFVKDPATGRYNAFFGGGFLAKCRGQDITIQGDSAESYGTQGVHYLIGNVRYRETRVSLDADRLTYFQAEERLLAEGRVRTVMSDGSTMTGPRAEYFRAVPPIRDVARLDATGNPTFELVTRDSVTGAPTPTHLVANHVSTLGDSLFYAGGNVVITRTDVNARGDSAMMNKVTEYARLLGRPVVEGKGERQFTLRGQIIDMFSKDRKLQRVLSRDSASVVSKDVTLVADTVDLRIEGDKLQRAFAWGPTRARASSVDRDIYADSLDVQMPNQKLHQVHALGKAFAETVPDSTKVTSTERDWIRGDTLVASFDTVPAPGDTSSTPRPRDLVAKGNASSFYQVPTQKGKAEKPAINYVRGRIITAVFDSGLVQSVTVVDRAAGVYLEPASDSTQTPHQGQQPARRGAQPATGGRGRIPPGGRP